MPRTDEEQHHTQRLERQHVVRRSDAFLEIEREALGTDYGATSWTDREEARSLAAILDLDPGTRALELGAGSGWPGIFLARATGCDVTLVDLPREGLRMARRRAADEGVSEHCRGLVADGARLPFPDRSFDAVYHCDVLC
jgi:SAM-dependent methyltransferase